MESELVKNIIKTLVTLGINMMILYLTHFLTEEERKEVYWAAAELVKQRLEKARSV